MLLHVAAGTIARSSQGVPPKILDFSEETLPSLPTLVMDQFASHVIRVLFLLLCPHLFNSSTLHKSQEFHGQGQSQSREEKSRPAEFREVSKKHVTTLRKTLDENEVACPVLQMALEMEADQDLSDEPGSLVDHVLIGLISACHDDPSFVPEASDYLLTLLRDPTSSHLLETIVSRCPEPVFDVLWTTYFERSLRKLSVHPVANFVVAKALERAQARQLTYTFSELRDSLESRVGTLRALIERAAALTILEAEVCEVCRSMLAQYIFDKIPVWEICFAFEVKTKEDRKPFVPCALSLKTKSEYTSAVKAKAVAPPDPETHEDPSKKHTGRLQEWLTHSS
ncbi:hypothetical protein V8E53_006919 [Lactarius tabidus]